MPIKKRFLNIGRDRKAVPGFRPEKLPDVTELNPIPTGPSYQEQFLSEIPAMTGNETGVRRIIMPTDCLRTTGQNDVRGCRVSIPGTDLDTFIDRGKFMQLPEGGSFDEDFRKRHCAVLFPENDKQLNVSRRGLIDTGRPAYYDAGINILEDQMSGEITRELMGSKHYDEILRHAEFTLKLVRNAPPGMDCKDGFDAVKSVIDTGRSPVLEGLERVREAMPRPKSSSPRSTLDMAAAGIEIHEEKPGLELE